MGGEPGAVLAVLALELAVVAGIAGRTVERQDAPALEQRDDRRGAVAAGPIQAQDQRGAMLGEVGIESGGHLGVAQAAVPQHESDGLLAGQQGQRRPYPAALVAGDDGVGDAGDDEPLARHIDVFSTRSARAPPRPPGAP